jgi:hypothetical protein
MDLRQRLSLLTKLHPDQEAPAEPVRPSTAELSLLLPEVLQAYPSPLTALAHLADASLLPDLQNFRWEQAAFIDTETTGLSTGAGTYVFLLGIGSYTNGVLTVRQYFLPAPEQEADFWSAALAELASFPLLVSFNGRTYDLPLINNRLTLMGMSPLEPTLHLDLLYPARRLWRRVLQSCALKSLEEHRLDWRREGDVAGELIPRLYFDYLHYGDGEPLQAVLAHNRRDIISLFELTAQLAEACREPATGFQWAEEFFGLADAKQQAGKEKEAAEAIIAGLARPGDPRLKQKYLQKLAKLHARAGRYPEALGVWQELAGLTPLSPKPLVEIAKIHEHRLRDLPAAWQAAARAAAICRRRKQLGVPMAMDEQQQLQKRLQRLERRLGVYKAEHPENLIINQ